jgi:hypothetical protein
VLLSVAALAEGRASDVGLGESPRFSSGVAPGGTGEPSARERDGGVDAGVGLDADRLGDEASNGPSSGLGGEVGEEDAEGRGPPLARSGFGSAGAMTLANWLPP